MEKWVYREKTVQEDEELKEEIKLLEQALTRKYEKPVYDKHLIHSAVKPFLLTEPRDNPDSLQSSVLAGPNNNEENADFEERKA